MSQLRSRVTTHVLDLVSGRPAAGVGVLLERVSGAGESDPIARGTTDANGRLRDLGPEILAPGVYRLRFDTASYESTRGFYPEVVICFRVDDPDERYHVPLLLGPWGFTTYRGS